MSFDALQARPVARPAVLRELGHFVLNKADQV
jgi:hypothetical protein